MPHRAETPKRAANNTSRAGQRPSWTAFSYPMSPAGWLPLDLNGGKPSSANCEPSKLLEGLQIDATCGSLPARRTAARPFAIGPACHRRECHSERRFGVPREPGRWSCEASLCVAACGPFGWRKQMLKVCVNSLSGPIDADLEHLL